MIHAFFHGEKTYPGCVRGGILLFVMFICVSACNRLPAGGLKETAGGAEPQILSVSLENGKTEEDGVYGIGEPFRPAGTVTLSDGTTDIAGLPPGSFSVTGYDSSRAGLCSVRLTVGEVSSDTLSIEIAGLAKRLKRGGTRELVLWAKEEVETVELSGAHITLVSSGNGPEGRRFLWVTKSGNMFALYDNASLTLDNVTLRGNDRNDSPLVYVDSAAFVLNNGSAITGNGGGGVHVKNGTFTMNSGEISGNSLNLKGEISRDSDVNRSGGVYVENGTFTMNGGKIFGNAVNADTEISDYFTNAGGVYVTNGTFTMNGGEIFNNAAYYVENPFQNRSGVYIGNGIITMNGGRICNNDGSGVLLFGETSFTMNGGAISGNDGNGVTVYEGLFTMEDGEISGHSVYGGIYVFDGTFTMEGGKISGNGGIYGGGVHTYGVFTMNGGEISGNSVEEEGGGVYAGSDSVFTMNGGTISGNSAGKKGGGVYIYTVYDSAFSKTGGTIYGYDPADNPLLNKCVDQEGVVQDNSGHTVYIGSGSGKRRENTSGPEDGLSAIYDSKTKTWTYTGNWDE